MAQEPAHTLFGLAGRTTKAPEKKLRVLNLPAHVNHNQQIVFVGGQPLLELALQIVDAVIEFVLLLDWPREFDFQARFSERASRFAERSHYRHFGGPHLKGTEQQDKDQQQD